MHDSASPRPPHGRYGKGYVADRYVGHDKSKDLPVRALLGASVGGSSVASLERFVQTLWDQRQTSMCTGFGFGRAAHVRLLKIAEDAGIDPTTIPRPSPVGIYAGRAYDRAPGEPLTDDGAAPSQIVRGMATVGVAPDAAWPPGGFDAAYDADPDGRAFVCAEPDLEELAAASAFVLQGWYRIDTTGGQRLADFEQAIAAGYPVAVGTQVDSAFEDYTGTGLIQPCDPDDDLGGHMVCGLGYETLAMGKKRYRICNSWGASWGDGGLFWASAEWIDALDDMYVVTVHPK